VPKADDDPSGRTTASGAGAAGLFGALRRAAFPAVIDRAVASPRTFQPATTAPTVQNRVTRTGRLYRASASIAFYGQIADRIVIDGALALSAVEAAVANARASHRAAATGAGLTAVADPCALARFARLANTLRVADLDPIAGCKRKPEPERDGDEGDELHGDHGYRSNKITGERICSKRNRWSSMTPSDRRAKFG
jgi:hypothetical protein